MPFIHNILQLALHRYVLLEAIMGYLACLRQHGKDVIGRYITAHVAQNSMREILTNQDQKLFKSWKSWQEVRMQRRCWNTKWWIRDYKVRWKTNRHDGQLRTRDRNQCYDVNELWTYGSQSWKNCTSIRVMSFMFEYKSYICWQSWFHAYGGHALYQRILSDSSGWESVWQDAWLRRSLAIGVLHGTSYKMTRRWEMG